VCHFDVKVCYIAINAAKVNLARRWFAAGANLAGRWFATGANLAGRWLAAGC
jgi:hypothetical protein